MTPAEHGKKREEVCLPKGAWRYESCEEFPGERRFQEPQSAERWAEARADSSASLLSRPEWNFHA